MSEVTDRVSPSSPGEKIAENEDLLSEILLRLPAKPILRFRTVCKHWLSLISEPHFSQRLSDHKKVILRSDDGKSFLVDQMIKEEEQPPMTYNVVEHGGGEITLPLITNEILEKVVVHSYKARENSDPDRVWNWNDEFAGLPLGFISRLLPAARYLDIWSICYLAYGPGRSRGLNIYFPNCSNNDKKRKIRCLRHLSHFE